MSLSVQPLFEQFYNFPPFFTLQPTPPTQKNQLDLWTKLIQSHCKQSNQFILTRTEPVFTNSEIKRSLSNDFITVLFNHMIATHAALPNTARGGGGGGGSSTTEQPGSPNKRPHYQQHHHHHHDSVIVLFEAKEKWHERIYDYAKKNGLIGGIATTYEILNDDEFSGMDGAVLEVLLRSMMRECRNIEVMEGESSAVEGVKFF